MPWMYFGSKHGLARRYPAPLPRGPIIEPFAGSAGYSVYWAESWRRVMLFDKDPEVVDTWNRLMAPDAMAHLNRVHSQLLAGDLSNPMTRYLGGAGGQHKVNAFVLRNWMSTRRRIEATLPRLQSGRWAVEERDVFDVPDVHGTWHIDPPYQSHFSTAGEQYTQSASGLDFAQLASWCQQRRGLVMVCEQAPAVWLPFRPLAVQAAMATANSGNEVRLELVWTQGLSSSPRGHRASVSESAAARRAERLRTGSGGFDRSGR